MTTGTYDTTDSYEIPERGPAGWVHYGALIQWTGEDRPYTVTKHPPTEKTRTSEYQVSIRQDHHTIRKSVSKRIVWEGDLTTEQLQGQSDFNANHNYNKTWNAKVLGILDIEQRLWSDSSLWGTWTGTVSNAGAAPIGPDNPWSTDDEFKLLDKLQGFVQGSDFNLASFLGAEGKDTVRFILDTANRLYRAVSAVKHGYFQRALSILGDQNQQWLAAESRRLGVNVVSARRVNRWKDRERRSQQLQVYNDQAANLRAALAGDKSPRKSSSVLANLARITGNQWLEFHLAVEPLLGDVYASAEKLAHHLNLPQKKSYKASRKKEANVTYGTYGVAYSQNCFKTRKQIKFIVSEPASVPQLLGLYNPEVVIWNALPLSFVGDYMFPIGQWLEARALSQTLTGEFVISTKCEWWASGMHFRNDVNVNPMLYAVWKHGATWVRDGSFNRTVQSGLPVPAPKFKPLGAFASWQKAATSVSLLVGSVTGGNLLRHLR